MKKIALIFLVLFACKKDTVEKTWFEVRDRVTDTPVKGVSVKLYKCDPVTDPFCGLIPWISGTTGEDGRCSFNSADFNRVTFTEVYKADYWEHRDQRTH